MTGTQQSGTPRVRARAIRAATQPADEGVVAVDDGSEHRSSGRSSVAALRDARRHRRRRSHGALVAAILALIAIATPAIWSWFTGELERDVAYVPVDPTADVAAPPEPAGPAPTTETRVVADPPVPPTLPRVAALPPVPASSVGVAPLAVQTVPAVRDVVIAVDGRLVSTDAAGRVVLTGLRDDTIVDVLGIQAEPAIAQVDVTIWSDGSTEGTRVASSFDDRTVELGLAVRHRVTVVSDDERIDAVSFDDGAGGALDLAVGAPAWVTAQRTVLVDGALRTERVAYAAVSGVSGGVRRAVVRDEFEAAPESLWRVLPATAA